MKKMVYRELQLRLRENRQLGQGGWGRWAVTKWVAQTIAVQPWRVIGPIAVGISLAGWWLNRVSLTKMMLRIFGGP